MSGAAGIPDPESAAGGVLLWTPSGGRKMWGAGYRTGQPADREEWQNTDLSDRLPCGEQRYPLWYRADSGISGRDRRVSGGNRSIPFGNHLSNRRTNQSRTV